jgi:hypothetical protein
MSIASCIVAPTPTAAPLQAQITGFFELKMRSVIRPPPSRTSSLESRPRCPATRTPGATLGGEVGAGAERAVAVAGDDDAAHRVVRIAQSKARMISSIMTRVKAFIFSGRCSVSVAMPSATA